MRVLSEDHDPPHLELLLLLLLLGIVCVGLSRLKGTVSLVQRRQTSNSTATHARATTTHLPAAGGGQRHTTRPAIGLDAALWGAARAAGTARSTTQGLLCSSKEQRGNE